MGRSRRAMTWVEAKHPRDDRGRFARKGSAKWFGRALSKAVHAGNASFGDFSMGAAPGHEPKGRLPGGLIDIKALSKAAPRTRAPEAKGGSGGSGGMHTSAVAAKALGTGGSKAPGDLKVGEKFTRHGATFEVTGEPKTARRAGNLVTLVQARRQDGKEGKLTLDSDVTMVGGPVNGTQLDKPREVRQPGGMTTPNTSAGYKARKGDTVEIADGRKYEVLRINSNGDLDTQEPGGRRRTLMPFEVTSVTKKDATPKRTGEVTGPADMRSQVLDTSPIREEHLKASNAAYHDRQIASLNKKLEDAKGAASRAEAARKDKGGRIQSAQEEKANRKVAEIRDQIGMHETARDGGPSIAEQQLARNQAADAERARLKAERDARLAAKLPEVKQVEPERSSGPGFDTTGLDERQIAMLSQYEPGPQLDQIAARFRAGNAPHPFRQQESKSLDERLAGLPEKARRIALASDEPERYSGVIASSVLKGYSNTGSGHDFFTVYTDEFGDEKSQLGLMTDKGTGNTANSFGAVHNEGTWVRVRPQGRHRDEEWAYVWVDAQKTRLPDSTKRVITPPKAQEAAKPEAGRAAPDGVAPTDGRPSMLTLAPKLAANGYTWQLARSKGRDAVQAPDVMRTSGGVMDNRPVGAELKNPADGTGDYRYRIFDENTGETIEEGTGRDAAAVFAKADRIFSSQRGGGVARSQGASAASAVRFEARKTERPKDRNRGDFGKGPFYDFTVVQVNPDGSENVKIKTSSMSRAEEQAAGLNEKEGAARQAAGGGDFADELRAEMRPVDPRKAESGWNLDRSKTFPVAKTSGGNTKITPQEKADVRAGRAADETRRRQITGEVLQAKAAAPASPQPEVYNKLLGPDSPIQNKSMRGLLEQMEAHGWTLTRGNQGGRTGHADIAAPDSMLGVTHWTAPDGRELVVQHIDGKKPYIMTERKYNAPDVTFKKAMAHVVTPAPPKTEPAPHVDRALTNLGLPELPRRDGMTIVTDHLMKPLDDAQKGMMPKGAYGGQGKTLPEVTAGLRAAAERTRENAATSDRLYGFGGADPGSARKLEAADTFERVAAELERMDVARKASLAEKERREAQPLDIRPPLRTPVKTLRASGRTPGGVTGPTRSNAPVTDVNDVPTGRLPGGVKPLDTSRATRESGDMATTPKSPLSSLEDETLRIIASGKTFSGTRGGALARLRRKGYIESEEYTQTHDNGITGTYTREVLSERGRRHLAGDQTTPAATPTKPVHTPSSTTVENAKVLQVMDSANTGTEGRALGFDPDDETSPITAGDIVMAPGMNAYMRAGVVEKVTRGGNVTVVYSTPSSDGRVYRMTRPADKVWRQAKTGTTSGTSSGVAAPAKITANDLRSGTVSVAQARSQLDRLTAPELKVMTPQLPSRASRDDRVASLMRSLKRPGYSEAQQKAAGILGYDGTPSHSEIRTLEVLTADDWAGLEPEDRAELERMAEQLQGRAQFKDRADAVLRTAGSRGKA